MLSIVYECVQHELETIMANERKESSVLILNKRQRNWNSGSNCQLIKTLPEIPELVTELVVFSAAWNLSLTCHTAMVRQNRVTHYHAVSTLRVHLHYPPGLLWCLEILCKAYPRVVSPTFVSRTALRIPLLSKFDDRNFKLTYFICPNVCLQAEIGLNGCII